MKYVSAMFSLRRHGHFDWSLWQKNYFIFGSRKWIYVYFQLILI
jgi:hypothetical protein